MFWVFFAVIEGPVKRRHDLAFIYYIFPLCL